MPPSASSFAAPMGFSPCSRDPVAIALLRSNASSLAGRFVMICRSISGLGHSFLFQQSTYVSFVDDHRPAGANAGIAIYRKAHPERPPSFFSLSPVLWRRQALLDVQSSSIQAVQLHHLRQSDRATRRQPCSWKVHGFELVATYQRPRLAMCKCDRGLAVTSHLVELCVLPGTVVEVFLQRVVFVCHGSRHGPHAVSQAYRRPHMGCEVQRSHESR